MNRLFAASCLAACPLLLTAPALAGWSKQAEERAYRILVTNDDGIGSPGIQVLAAALADVGEVHVVAPCGEQSGSSMSVQLRAELRLRWVESDGQLVGQCVDTTPANTVLLAMTALAPEDGYDLVVSGVNRGANVGTASHMSGTVGAAMAGAYYGVPSIAASLGGRAQDFDYSARFVAGFVREMRQRPPIPGVVFSINIPHATEAEIAGVKVAGMGGSHLVFDYQEVESDDGQRRFQPRIGLSSEAPAGSDTDAYLSGHITIAPLRFDWTAHDAMTELRGWSLGTEIGR